MCGYEPTGPQIQRRRLAGRPARPVGRRAHGGHLRHRRSATPSSSSRCGGPSTPSASLDVRPETNACCSSSTTSRRSCLVPRRLRSGVQPVPLSTMLTGPSSATLRPTPASVVVVSADTPAPSARSPRGPRPEGRCGGWPGRRGAVPAGPCEWAAFDDLRGAVARRAPTHRVSGSTVPARPAFPKA